MTSPASTSVDRAELFAAVSASSFAYSAYQSAVSALHRFEESVREECFQNAEYRPGIAYAKAHTMLSADIAERLAAYMVAAGHVRRVRQAIGDL